MDKYISEIAYGKRVVTPRIKRKKYYDSVKSKSKAVGRTLNKNIKYIGKKIGKVTYNQAKLIKAEQQRKGGFYRLHSKTLPTKSNKKVKYYKRKGKKYYPVYKKSRKHKIKKHSNYNYSNPFNLDF